MALKHILHGESNIGNGGWSTLPLSLPLTPPPPPFLHMQSAIKRNEAVKSNLINKILPLDRSNVKYFSTVY